MNHLPASIRLQKGTIAQEKMIESSKKLWAPKVWRKLSKAEISEQTASAYSQLAAEWLRLNPERIVKVTGVSLRVPKNHMETVWLQVMEWECGRIERRMLRYLTGYRREMPDLNLWPRNAGDEPINFMQWGIEVAQADRISRSLLNEVGGKAKCRPAGSFRVGLPEDACLCALGVTNLRIWIVPPDALWVAFESGDQLGPSVRWSAATPHLNRWIVASQIVPMLHLTLTALWKDLCLRAETLKGGSASILKEEKASGLSRVRYAGHFAWEAPMFLRLRHRVGSHVRGHLRRLPYGRRASRLARFHARRHGINRLPPGMTYVRSHHRSQ
jgi:hypothetical protein